MRDTVAQSRRLKKDTKAVSPAISTVIITSAVVVLLLVAISFADNFLTARMAENEFSAMKQFMQTAGLQIDDVTWTIGRTQTIRYVSRFGHVDFQSIALNYTLYVDKGSGYVPLASNTTGILVFDMPIVYYSVGNDYHERIFPSADRSFLQKGTAAPVAHVYVVEQVPMNDGNFIRIVVAPSIRMLNSTISTSGETKNYFKLYLPILSAGINPHYSQSVTLAGNTVSAKTEADVNRFKIHLSTPKASLGFNQHFFDFDETDIEVNLPPGSIVQFYTGEVIVSLGLHA